MARLIEMPKLSPTMEEGQIAAWHAKEGDSIEVDDLLAEVETDKATMEFRSFDRGTLLKILVEAGAVVKLGDPVAIIGEKGENVDALLEKAGTPSGPAPAKKGPQPSKPEPSKPEPSKEQRAEPEPEHEPPAGDGHEDGRVRASPYVRKQARERGIDLSRVAGSGPGGRIVARDLEHPAGAAPRTAKPTRAPEARRAPEAPTEEPEVRPLSMMRKTIARRLTESKQTVPHFYLTIDVDAGALDRLRKQLNSDLDRSFPERSVEPTRSEPTKISFNDLVLKAAAIALTRVPAVNAQFTPEALVFHHRVDISVAVAVEDGLVTPVVRHADRKSVIELSHEMRELAERARNRKLTPEEMMNGTFSLSNLGMYGIEEFAAVINPPEGAILAVGAVRSEPVLDGDRVIPGKRMKLTLSCDHRVVDGATGAQYLAALRKILEGPTQILAY
jgi:pyruvate dehydrogenase E2 component (dihydrolipoamide acetyltransferase)